MPRVSAPRVSAPRVSTPRVSTPRERLRALGLAPAKSRGQNFLRDGNLIGRLAREISAAAGEGRRFLEIGPGLGALTRPLLAAGADILAVELDRGLAENLAGLAAENPGRLTVLNRDILTFEPDETARFLFGSLPYNISSPIIFWFLRRRRSFPGALFLLQKEMADRLAAGPGEPAYGRLAAALGLWCRVERLMAIPASAFHPRPRVESAAVLLRLRPPEEEPPVTPDIFGRFSLAAFGARRQTLLNNLSRAYGREPARKILADFGLPRDLRAEKLAPPVLAALAAVFETVT